MDQQEISVHVYRISAANKTVLVICGTIPFCLAGWLCYGLFVPHLRARFAHQGLNTASILAFTLASFGFAVFSTIRFPQMRIEITNSQVEVVDAFSSRTVPFADISGRRSAGGYKVLGMYLYRRGKSRIFVRESMFRLDDFYMRWKASIYDLDKADRRERKLAGKQRALDWFSDDDEQHPAIGGPDISA